MNKSSMTYRMFEAFEGDKFSFSYQGNFVNNIVMTAIDLINSSLKEDSQFVKLRHKLSYLMIESFQNIIRYGDEPKSGKEKYRNELFLVRNIEDHYYIISANLVENNKIDYVHSKLEEVNSLEKKELNKLYQKTLTNNQFTEAGGAGLGFIEMSRKTRQKLDYKFVKIDENYSYFYLLLKFHDPLQENESEHIDMNWAIDFHKTSSKNQTIAIHKGNFSPIVIDPVLNMVQKNIKSKMINIQKIAFQLMLEALQNVSLHSFEINKQKNAIFMIRQENSHHYLSTGNFILIKKSKVLKKQLQKLKQMDIKSLKKLFEEIIHKKNRNLDQEHIGLGLIDIAIESNKQFEYHFQKISEEIAFYTFKVKI